MTELLTKTKPSIAYFSMEVAIDSRIPTYSGGLGVLAADTMRAAADLNIPMIGVTLLSHKGYFRQHLDGKGKQVEKDVSWSPEEFLDLLPPRIMVKLNGRQVALQVWRYNIQSEVGGGTMPLYFLDTALSENSPEDMSITDYLYGGDERYRLTQEAILGLGGIAMLRNLGYESIQVYHMNEGHSALISLALLEERTWGRSLETVCDQDWEAIKQRCVFTTHTPVAAAHDKFPIELVREVLGQERTKCLMKTQCCDQGALNMTQLALIFSRFVNGVSMRHEEVSQIMYPNHRVDFITNGVHAETWISPPFASLYDKYMPQWRRDNLYLKYAIRIPLAEIPAAHYEAKQRLFEKVKERKGVVFNPDVFTIGFARRSTAYKRPALLFYDLERLKRIVVQNGPLQIIYAGKAHPKDGIGKELIQEIFIAAEKLQGAINVIYLEDYDVELAKYICSGVDVWLNTPQRPLEASGTSGMKAALNGVPSLSILDGWWIEGHIEGVTGWAIGDGWQADKSPEQDASSLYDKLDNHVLPLYYNLREAYTTVMKSAIAQNGSYFNAQRMMYQYLQNSYLRPLGMLGI